MTVAEILDAHEAHLLTKGSNLAKIRSQLRTVRAALGAREASTLRAADLEAYRAERRKQLTRRQAPTSDATINRELTYLRAAMRRALRDEKIDRVPQFEMSPETTVRSDWWTVEALGRVREALEAAGEHCLSDLVLFYFVTGWRKSEALGLRWEEIDFAREVATLPAARSKNRVPRVLPLVGPLMALLRRRERARGASQTPFVFDRDGRVRKDFRRAWTTAKRRAGVDPSLTIHGFRRTFATNAHRAGVDRLTAQRLGGWKSPAMLDRYTQSDARSLAGGLEKIVRDLGDVESPRTPPGPKRKKKSDGA